jgi:hypothetical protein
MPDIRPTHMFDVNIFNVPKFDEILNRGLSYGLGDEDGKMCIEAAICHALGMPHGDNPLCVAESVRRFKIRLNDCEWSSPEARAKGLRNLGLAQLGSKDVVDNTAFSSRLAMLMGKVLLPQLIREYLPYHSLCLEAAYQCENASSIEQIKDFTFKASLAINSTLENHFSVRAARSISTACRYASDLQNVSAAANKIASAVDFTNDKYLFITADLALQVLQELNSPGCALLTPA